MTTAPDPRLGNPEWVDNWTLGPGFHGPLPISQLESACR